MAIKPATPHPSALQTAVLPLLLSCLILISAGLYNGFPLVTSDTGTYINSALEFTVPDDRPIVYGLFIRATGLKFSLWFVIMVQGLLLGWVLLRCLAAFAPRVRSVYGQLIVLGATAWSTGVSWYCSQLMPDIFTAIGLLCLALLLLGKFRSRAELVGLLALLLVSSLVHNSNLLINTTVVLMLGAVGIWQRLFRRGLLQWRNWLLAGSIVFSSWVVLPAVHAGFGGGFALSKASPAFLMARLTETGILEKYLSRSCQTGTEYKLCAFRDKLPNDAISFMWDSNSPYNQTGGLAANRAEYQQIIRAILTSPRYYPRLASEAIQATLRQLTHVGHGDGLEPFRENTNPYWKVQNFSSYELKEYMSSLQNRGQLVFTALNERMYAAQLLALLTLGGLIAWHRNQKMIPSGSSSSTATTDLILLLTVLGTGIVANAFVTGALANVLDRLQGRVAWLLPFVAILVVAQHGPELLRWLQARCKTSNTAAVAVESEVPAP